jgi:hypothetical protein
MLVVKKSAPLRMPAKDYRPETAAVTKDIFGKS